MASDRTVVFKLPDRIGYKFNRILATRTDKVSGNVITVDNQIMLTVIVFENNPDGVPLLDPDLTGVKGKVGAVYSEFFNASCFALNLLGRRWANRILAIIPFYKL